MNDDFPSWGGLPHARHKDVISVSATHLPDFRNAEGFVLPRGLGRSYGDVCLNDGGTLIDTHALDSILSFDAANGLITCGAGTTLGRILEAIAGTGWFLPVVPGTRHVTVGGAIANDIHGKNHHRLGSFGCFVDSCELLRSNGDVLRCSPTYNPELFRATIAGLGLTGLLLAATLRLKRVPSADIDAESIPYANLDALFALFDASDATHEYTVAWLDCLALGNRSERGIFLRGNHSRTPATARRVTTWRVPRQFPNWFLTAATVRAFNAAYFRLQSLRIRARLVSGESFFFPLDRVSHWNRLYGRRGFYQYQCVVPQPCGRDAIRDILARIAHSGLAAFLGVIKILGEKESPGILSFSRPGITLALDFPNQGADTLALFNELDRIVADAKGALYPAKDARMPPSLFAASFPNWREFSPHIDPQFSSTFWRRVMGNETKL